MNERDKKLAEQAGMVIVDDKFSTHGKFAEKFAALIRANEREACAKLARKVANATRPDDFALDKCYEIEIAIRARGQA
jgi:hypothetical protein